MPSRHISFSMSSRFKTLIDKLKTLHLPASTPSESSNLQYSNSDSTGPPFLDANNPSAALSADDDPDGGVTDAVIVDSLLVPAAVTVSSSRRHSAGGDGDGDANGDKKPRNGHGHILAAATGTRHPLDLTDSERETRSQATYTSTILSTNNTETRRRHTRFDGRYSSSWKARFMHSMRFGPLRKVKYYFDLRFDDTQLERQYIKERWYARKQLALLASLFVLTAWILSMALIPQPWKLYSWITYFLICGIPACLLPICVVLDFPRYQHYSWQLLLFISTWSWPMVFAAEMRMCGYYQLKNSDEQFPGFGGGDCGQKDFQTMLYFAAAYPVLALMSLEQTRGWALAGAGAYCGVLGTTIVSVRLIWMRNLVIFLLFQVVINLLSHSQEKIDRKAFLVRSQLKVQYRATQKAQHLEHKAADSKKRFVSYIFHEVRVPLNAALLALQNLVGEGVFTTCDTDQRDVVDALSGSLGMMAQVLNDVLDFNRMEDGKFVCTYHPIDLHSIVRSLCVGAKVVAENKGVELRSDLDERVDDIVCGEEGKEGGRGRKVMVGDEMRVRQVLSNLIGNACKFTGRGGCVVVRTKLLWPDAGLEDEVGLGGVGVGVNGRISNYDAQSIAGRSDTDRISTRSHGSHRIEIDPAVPEHTVEIIPVDGHRTEEELIVDGQGEGEENGGDVEGDSPATLTRKTLHQQLTGVDTESVAIIRIEVEDSGTGIRRSELVGNRLFSPYIQTEEGRRQGGKGTGLGLALVRHIVKLSGGRLGLRTKVGVGSCFWVELPFEVRDADKPDSSEGSGGDGTEGGGKMGSKVVDADKKETWKKLRMASEGSGKKRSGAVKTVVGTEPFLPALDGLAATPGGEKTGELGGVEMKMIVGRGMGAALEWRGRGGDDEDGEGGMPTPPGGVHSPLSAGSPLGSPISGTPSAITPPVLWATEVEVSPPLSP
ncbi:hypothetical protein HDV00_012146, partial [Rhizophlyctis rosea]